MRRSSPCAPRAGDHRETAFIATPLTASSSPSREREAPARQGHRRGCRITTAPPSSASQFRQGLVQSVFPLTLSPASPSHCALLYAQVDAPSKAARCRARFELGATTTHPNAQSEFHTDSGRSHRRRRYPARYRGLHAADQSTARDCSTSASFTNLATEYLHTQGRSDSSIARSSISSASSSPTAKSALASPVASERGPTAEDRLFNQPSEWKGDEVEAQRDPCDPPGGLEIVQ